MHDAHGRVVERHDAGGGVWRFEHTSAGRPRSITDPLGARETVRYGPPPSPALEVDALGQATVRDYDVLGNVVAISEPSGVRWEYSYDALMRLTATIDPAGARWSNEYDANGRLVATTDPVGVRQSAALDPFGRVMGINDDLVAIGFELDALGRVVAERRPDGTQLRADYDLCDRLTLLEDAAGEITTYTYTAAGRRLDAAKWVGKQAIKHADTISLVPACSRWSRRRCRRFWAVSVGASLLSAGAALDNGDIGSAALSLVGARLGVKGPLQGRPDQGPEEHAERRGADHRRPDPDGPLPSGAHEARRARRRRR